MIETSIPEDEAVTSISNTDIIHFDSPRSPTLNKLKRFSVEASMAADAALERRRANMSPPLPSLPPSTFSQASTTVQSGPPSGALGKRTPDAGGPEGNGRSSSLARREAGMAPLNLPPAAEYEEGLMPAEDWTTVVSDAASTANRSVSSRDADCLIGPQSSLYQLKGFCDGAQAFKQGGHWDGVKKTAGYVAVS
jgi:hypothetical protein